MFHYCNFMKILCAQVQYKNPDISRVVSINCTYKSYPLKWLATHQCNEKKTVSTYCMGHTVCLGTAIIWLPVLPCFGVRPVIVLYPYTFAVQNDT